MTTPITDFDPSALNPEPIEGFGVPDHRASSGEAPRPALSTAADQRKRERPGIFAGARTRASSDSGPKTAKPRKEPVPKLTAGAKKQIEKVYLLIGGFVRPMNQVLGEEIIDAAPKCAESVYELAQQNDAFRAALQSLMQTSLVGAVIFAHMPILLAVMASYSKSDKTKMFAAGSLMALKMSDEVSLSDLIGNMDEPESK